VKLDIMNPNTRFADLYPIEHKQETPVWAQRIVTHVAAASGRLPSQPQWQLCKLEDVNTWRHLVRRVQLGGEA